MLEETRHWAGLVPIRTTNNIVHENVVMGLWKNGKNYSSPENENRQDQRRTARQRKREPEMSEKERNKKAREITRSPH